MKNQFLIPKIGVNAAISFKKVRKDGQMPMPDSPDDIAYYDFSKFVGLGGDIGGPGNAIFSGHVDSGFEPCDCGKTPPPCEAVLWDLDKLLPGDLIKITFEENRYIYKVSINKFVGLKTNWKKVFSSTKHSSLTIITCTGDFNRKTNSYNKRQLVYAKLFKMVEIPKLNVKKVVSKAKDLLSKHYYDEAHNLAHHENVWALAQEIIKHMDFSPNHDLIYISCMWHDVITKKYSPAELKNHKKITEETAKYLKAYMLKIGFENVDANICYEAVKHHEFGNKPRNIEGKILYDADKLDALSVKRALWMLKSSHGKQVVAGLKNKIKGRLAITYIRSTFNFEYSKLLFDKKVKSILQNKEAKLYAKQNDIDLEKIKNIFNKKHN